MSANLNTPSSIETLPTAALNSLSLQNDTQTTPTPKNKKAMSESSLSTMTPPNSTRGAPLNSDASEKMSTASTDPIFIRSQIEDDVFGRSASTTPNQGTASQSTSAAAIAKVQANLATPISMKQTPRPDRMNSPITPANAQGVLPPEACVFVANLATTRTDDQLELACHNHFDIFGECHIKVRRDKNRHPFALVQYYRIEDANNAIKSSHEVVIDGRNIRTEHAQARRSVVLTKVGGGIVNEEDAKKALGNFGPIAQMHPTTNRDARDHGLPEGMWIQFAYYLDYKDAVKSFNSTTTAYRIHVPPDTEGRTQVGPSGSPAVKGFRTPRSTTDQKSIFVGNLPPETTEHHLKQMFSACGAIRAVNIIHKPIQGGLGHNVFGFVEFSTISEAETAANMEVEINGTKIRVEPKEYSARRHTRLSYSPITSPYYRGPRHNLSQNWVSPGMATPYHPNATYFTITSPTHHIATHGGYSQVHMHHPPNELSTPFHTHAGGPSYSTIYATPPPSSHHAHRINELLHTGSPHHPITHAHQPWNQFNPGASYGGSMMQIPEESEY